MPRTKPLAGDDVISVKDGENVAVEVAPEAPPTPKAASSVVGKSPGQLAWVRLRRDRVGMVSGFIVLGFILTGILAPLIEWIYGYGPNVFDSRLLNMEGVPTGYAGGIDFTGDNPSGHVHILGVQPGTGRDIFMQLVYGARTSLLIAFIASSLAVVIGIFFGVVAAFFGGWVDAAISWFIDFMLSFPFLLFALAVIPVINSRIGDQLGEVSPEKRVLTLILIFALFGWMSTARLVRGQVLSLREREYVEAARAAGAGAMHIMFRQILPNLWAPILVTFSLFVPATVTAEAALSFLNIGVIEPTPDWGRMVGDSIKYLQSVPTYTLFPGLSIFILVLTFNIFGDSLRDALDPKSLR
ncbi:MAG TPA: ABC transporter permease [Micromonosporaceae bacterium]